MIYACISYDRLEVLSVSTYKRFYFQDCFDVFPNININEFCKNRRRYFIKIAT